MWQPGVCAGCVFREGSCTEITTRRTHKVCLMVCLCTGIRGEGRGGMGDAAGCSGVDVELWFETCHCS
jgi:hypothetical protein